MSAWRGRAAGLVPVLAITALNSIGTSVVTSGIFFVAKSKFGWGTGDEWRSALLGLFIGLPYIPAALLSHRILDALEHRAGLSPRTTLLSMMVVMLAMSVVPWAISGTGPAAQWGLVAFTGAYAAMTGLLWPIVEGFVAGGRAGPSLRRATGAFNMTWAPAVVLGLLLIGPLLERWPTAALLLVAASHLASIPMVLMLPDRPAAHGSLSGSGGAAALHSERERERARRILVALRFELVATYAVVTALGSIMPFVASRLAIASEWQTPIWAIWGVARLVPFVLMAIWHGWHGRWSVAVLGGLMLLAGFGLAVFSPLAAEAGEGTIALGRALLGVGLVLLGLGVGVIYAGAIAYAMEVGSSEVHAAGKHEAMIGMGYTVGPACVMLASWPAVRMIGGHDRFEWVVVAGVWLAALALVGYGLMRALRKRSSDGV